MTVDTVMRNQDPSNTTNIDRTQHHSEQHPCYTDTLRDMFLKINPHHLSCPYKEMLDKHAVQNLLDCEDEFDIYAPRQNSAKKYPNICQASEEEMAEQDREKGSEDDGPLMTRFLNQLRMELPKPEDKQLVS